MGRAASYDLAPKLAPSAGPVFVCISVAKKFLSKSPNSALSPTKKSHQATSLMWCCSKNETGGGAVVHTFGVQPPVVVLHLHYVAHCIADCNTMPISIPAGDYILWLGWDSSPGFALDCNFKDQGVKKPYCLIQGNHLNLMDECNAIKDCDGFTTQISDNGRFGYLVRYEGWASARQREGWMFFAKSSSNPTSKKNKGRRRLQHVNGTIEGP